MRIELNENALRSLETLPKALISIVIGKGILTLPRRMPLVSYNTQFSTPHLVVSNSYWRGICIPPLAISQTLCQVEIAKETTTLLPGYLGLACSC